MRLQWQIVILGMSATLLLFIVTRPEQNEKITISDQPTLYFTKGTISTFDGTPRGMFQLFRIRGFNGEPELVYSGGETHLPAPVTAPAYRLTRPHVPPSFGGSEPFPTFKIGITWGGKEEVTELVPAPASPYPLSIASSSDGRYLAIGRNFCTAEPVDEPCPTSIDVTVYDYVQGAKLVFSKQDLGVSEFGGMMPFVYFSPNGRLFIDVQSQQERYAQFLSIVDLPNLKPRLVYQNVTGNYPEVAGPNYVISEVLSTDTIFATKFSFDPKGDPSTAFVKYNISSETEEVIDAPGGLSPDFPVTQQGYFFSPDYNAGLQFRDFQTKSTRTLVVGGVPKSVTPDGRFAVMSYPYADGGYNSERLELWDTKTKKRRVIYDQRFGTGNPGPINASTIPALKVGDTLSGFVSLEVDGQLAMDNALN